MKEIKINLNRIEAVKTFVNILGKYDVDATIKSGKYIIDAKSIMGIFSLDLSKPVTLVVETDDSNKVDSLISELSDNEVCVLNLD